MDAPRSLHRVKGAKVNLNDVAAYRKLLAENQNIFWQRFGVTQSGGSRYESGRTVPRSVRMLISLYAAGKIDDEDLRVAAGGRAKRDKGGG